MKILLIHVYATMNKIRLEKSIFIEKLESFYDEIKAESEVEKQKPEKIQRNKQKWWTKENEIEKL